MNARTRLTPLWKLGQIKGELEAVLITSGKLLKLRHKRKIREAERILEALQDELLGEVWP